MECDECDGTGECPEQCDGDDDCDVCNGSDVCPHCSGTGEMDEDDDE